MQAHRKKADITTTQRASVPPLKPDDASAAMSASRDLKETAIDAHAAD
jgi:hypothetical protein